VSATENPAEFDAFISYRHDSDLTLASALHLSLQKLGKRWNERRALRVFRDQTSFGATSAVASSLNEKLRESRCFILIASPESASAPWVNREVGWWLEIHGVDNLLIALARGDIRWAGEAGDFDWATTTALPSCLKGKYREEPKFVDFRGLSEAEFHLSSERFQNGVADLSAPIQGKNKDTIIGNDLKAYRRTLTLMRAAVAVLSLLLVAAVGLYLYAAQQRTRADNRFNDVRSLANSFLFEFDDAIAGLAGATKARELVVKKALEYLDKLSKESGSDDSLSYELASSYSKVGEVQGNPYQSNLGDSKGAISSYAKSVAILERLVAHNPANSEWREALGDGQVILAHVLEESGETGEALNRARESRDSYAALLQQKPGSFDYSEGLATAYERLGDIYKDTGDLQMEEQNYRKYYALTKQLVKINPKEWDALHSSYTSAQRMGDLLDKRADYSKALEYYRESQTSCEALLASVDPLKSTHERRDLAWGHERIARVEDQTKNYTQAVADYNKAIDLLDKLFTADKVSAQYGSDLQDILREKASALGKSGDNAGAIATYRRSLQIAEPLAANDPNNQDLQTELSKIYAELGDQLIRAGDRTEGVAVHAKETRLKEKLAPHPVAP